MHPWGRQEEVEYPGWLQEYGQTVGSGFESLVAGFEMELCYVVLSEWRE